MVETPVNRSAPPSTRSHILPTASTMIGISTTLIGLVKIVEGRIGPSRVDEYAGMAAVLFLFSAVSSYMAIRLETRPRISHLSERVADHLFLIGMGALTLIALLFAYEMV
jgi:hypothetical protein